jgi:transcriptional regulator with XRE-family HTH domain
VSETLHKLEVGRRLRAAIEALGLTQAGVASTLNTAPSKLGNWLRGDNYPAAWFVKRFCDRYGITTDWIYRGIVSGIDSDLADKLWRSEQKTEPEPTAGAPRPKSKGKSSPRPFPAAPVTEKAAKLGCEPKVVPIARPA